MVVRASVLNRARMKSIFGSDVAANIRKWIQINSSRVSTITDTCLPDNNWADGVEKDTSAAPLCHIPMCYISHYVSHIFSVSWDVRVYTHWWDKRSNFLKAFQRKVSKQGHLTLIFTLSRLISCTEQRPKQKLLCLFGNSLFGTCFHDYRRINQPKTLIHAQTAQSKTSCCTLERWRL